MKHGQITSSMNIVATDKPGQLTGSTTGGCCKEAETDHLQSMQSSTQHPTEGHTEGADVLKLRETWINTCLYNQRNNDGIINDFQVTNWTGQKRKDTF